MPPTARFFSFLLATTLWLAGAADSQAQWLVYELQFTPEADSVNFTSYRSAYLVAPANGGAATLILTTDDGGRYYAVADGSAKFFLAANSTQRKAAFSALAVSGNSQALYTASGDLNRSLLLDGPDGSPKVLRVAENLAGRLMAADDESDKGPAGDGSIGMIGSALITGTLREDLTGIATRHFASQTLVTAYVVELLEKYGYAPDQGSIPVKAELNTIQEDGSIIDTSLFPPEALPKAP